MWIYIKILDQVIWLAENWKWAWPLNLFSMTMVKICFQDRQWSLNVSCDPVFLERPLGVIQNIRSLYCSNNVYVIITAYEESQLNRDFHFPVHSVCFVPKGNVFDVYFTTLQLMLVPCGGSRTSTRTSPQCRLYFISFGISGTTVVYLKMEFCSCIR